MRWLGTSWKMTKTLGEATAWAEEVCAGLTERGWAQAPPVHAFVVPPATATTTVNAVLGEESALLLGVQNAHWEDAGAWTGEISVPQAADAGAALVEIGHSERREAFGETIETTRLKVAAALRHHLIPLLCVGEPGSVREAGGGTPYVMEQAEGALAGLDPAERARVLIAYEPVWAIGDAGREARPEEIAEPIEALITLGVEAVLYGGSVNRDNAAGILAVPGVGGLFVGRAAWHAEDFLALLDVTASAPRAEAPRDS